MPKEYFANVKIGICGNFGENWPKEKIRRFVVNNGGEVVDPKDPQMTHLVCSIKAYESRMFAVQEAIRRSKASKALKIVTFDWLEDCLHERKKKPVYGSYNVRIKAKEKRQRQIQRNAERAAAIDRDMTHFAKVVSDAKVSYNLDGYHCYTDPTGFPYDVTLTRTNVFDNTNQKVVLRLYESDEAPYEYACYSSVFTPDGRDVRHVHALPPCDFEAAFEAFAEVFKERTAHDWPDRANANGYNEDGTKRHTAYTYRQPSLGPLGMDVPPGRRFAHGQQNGEDDQDEEEIVLVDFNDTDDSEDTLIASHGHSSSQAEAQFLRNDANDSDLGDEQYETADKGNLEGGMDLDLPVDSGYQPNLGRATRQLQGHVHTDLIEAPQYPSMPAPASLSGFRPTNVLESDHRPAQVTPMAVKHRPGIVDWDWSGRAQPDGGRQ